MLGDLSRAPPGVQAAAARLMRSSAQLCESAPPGSPRRVVNVYFSYTSTEELGTALGRLRGGLAGWQLLPGDVDWVLVQAAMYTGAPFVGGSPPVDLLIRTSGEERLSDFLLWQSSGALLQWLPVLWPQLSFLDLVRAIRAWQEAQPALEALAAAAVECRQQAAKNAGSETSGWLLRRPAVVSKCSCGGSGCSAAGVDAGGEQGANAAAHGGCSCTCGSSTGSGVAAGAVGGALHLASLSSMERAPSASLSVISEDEPSCAPHPSQQLRVENFLRQLQVEKQEWIACTLAAEAKAADSAD